MAKFEELAATAQRLIKANGREVSLVALGETPADPAKPWEGPADPRAPASASLDLFAVFVPPSSAAKLGLGVQTEGLFKRAEQIMILSAGTQVDLQPFDEVLDDTITWKIEGLEVLRPAGDTVLAFMGVRR